MRQALRALLPALTALCTLITPAAAQQGSIVGRVTGTANAQALASANVHAVAVGGRVAARTLTNTDGRFRLMVDPGTYAVHVEMVGYEAIIQEGVQVSANSTVTMDVALSQAVFQLNPVVVSASKKAEKATDAPAHVEVVSERDIQARPTVTPVDHLRGTPGVDVVSSGVQSTNVVVRGFNNIFSGALHTLTDHRIAGVPSLRVNFMHFVPAGDDDLQRMEVVLGPGAALYGPNTAHGVLHMITKSPLIDQGTTLSVSGGEQSLFHLSGRTAHKLSERFGVKLSGQYLQAEEWGYVDPVEVQEQQLYTTHPAAPLLRQRLQAALQLDAAEVDRRVSLIGRRDNDLQRWSGEARADWRATDDLGVTFQGGLTMVGNGVELTGLGAGQAQDWRYSYLQTRATYGRAFGQVYLNMSDAGDTYLLRNGAPIVDKSRMLVAQLQHGFPARAWQNFTYGVDYIRTTPRTEGSINGSYEDDDETTEVGAYVQSETALHRMFDLVLAGRVDDHSALPDPLFSPRAGLVFKPAENQAFRATYNQAFSTPSSLNQFLDLSSAIPDPGAALLGYSVRVQGTGTVGFTFAQPDGSYLMRSPFFQGGQDPLPAGAVPNFYPAAVQVVATSASLPAPVVDYLNSHAAAIAAQVGTVYRHPATGDMGVLADLDVPAVSPIRESTTTTFEVGYRGVLWNRLMLAGDVWWEKLEDFVTPLTTVSPLLLLNGPQLGAYLVPRLMTDLGMTQEQATAIVTGLASVPLGVITSPQMSATGAQLLTTYYNVQDQINLNGFDLAATFLLTPMVSLSGTASFVSDDVFTSDRGENITLNAPKRKFTTGINFRQPDWGLDTELRVRYNDAFPVRSGVYNGTLCIGGTEPGAEDCVDNYTLLDMNVSYRLPMATGATVQLMVQNLLDEDYRSFPGVPTIGRMGMLRLKYNF
ncbi:MAG TPA: TonB-dependent receptor [Longimicrobiales bacterium]|nr:TonB-dependent receptor [Longimicrobiales bacterium]